MRITMCRDRKTKALNTLRRCAGWSAPFFLAFSRVETNIIHVYILINCVMRKCIALYLDSEDEDQYAHPCSIFCASDYSNHTRHTQ